MIDAHAPTRLDDVDELAPDPTDPADTDLDGTPDFRDQDSDDDRIPDDIGTAV